jgi:hypothetical protein
MFFCRAFLAQVELLGGVRRRDLNFGGLAAPLGQQAVVLTHGLTVVLAEIWKQILVFSFFEFTMVYAVSLESLAPEAAVQVVLASRWRAARGLGVPGCGQEGQGQGGAVGLKVANHARFVLVNMRGAKRGVSPNAA